jgi:S1-C subfamily serine protease
MAHIHISILNLYIYTGRILLLLTCWVVIMFSSGCAQLPFGQLPESVRMAEEGYISLEVWTPWLFQFQGSAVIVHDGVAVSNRHLMKNVAWSKGTLYNNLSTPIDNIVLIDTLDLAVFDIPCGVGRPIRWNKQTHVQQGQAIYALGTTRGTPVFKGVVVNHSFNLHHSDVELPKAKKELDRGWSITNGFIYKGKTSDGFSGGPILERKGELVGLNQGRISKFFPKNPLDKKIATNETFGFAYHIKDVITAITKYAPNKMYRCS